MTFEQLNYFIAVVESDTFLYAAYKMNYFKKLIKHILRWIIIYIVEIHP